MLDRAYGTHFLYQRAFGCKSAIRVSWNQVDFQYNALPSV